MGCAAAEQGRDMSTEQAHLVPVAVQVSRALGAIESAIDVASNNAELDQREQTAATILAALIPVMNERPVELTPEVGAALAVRWADALRAELAKVNP